MYSTHDEGNSVVAERFIKTLMGKTYKKLAANDGKSHLRYLYELVDECNKSCHYYIGRKPY